MAKYDCSSFSEYANLLKKDIKAAMRGKIRVQYRDDGGWYYGTDKVESVIVEDAKKVLIL